MRKETFNIAIRYLSEILGRQVESFYYKNEEDEMVIVFENEKD